MNIQELAIALGQSDGVLFTKTELEECVALVAAQEREECAKVCEEESNRWAVPVTSDDYRLMWAECATAIRARGQA